MSKDFECGVRYRVFAGKEGRLTVKEKMFTGITLKKAQAKRASFCKRLENDGNFYAFDSWYK